MAPGLPPGMTRHAAAAWIGEDPQAAVRVFRDLMSAGTGTWRAVQNGMFTFACPFPAAWFPAALDCTLAGVARQIRCPALVIGAEAGRAFKGQAGTLYDALARPRAFLMFTTGEGAGDHCQAGRRCCAPGALSAGSRKPSAARPPPAPDKPPGQATSAAGARRHALGQRSKTTRSCRIEGVAGAHIYAHHGIPAHTLSTLPVIPVKPFRSF